MWHNLEFAEHIGVSDNQLPFGVLESVFFSLFRAMAGLLAGASGGGILKASVRKGPLFWGFLKMVNKCNPSHAKRSFLTSKRVGK